MLELYGLTWCKKPEYPEETSLFGQATSQLLMMPHDDTQEFVCLFGVLQPSQQRGHVEPVS